LKKAGDVTASSKSNDLNILPLSRCHSRFCEGHALLDANKPLQFKILAGYDQKYFAGASSPHAKQRPKKSTRKSIILNILRISPCGSIFYRWRKLSWHGKPLQFNILREFEEKIAHACGVQV
jgi:hypothetical protein